MMSDDADLAANLLERISRLVRTEEQIGDLYPAQWGALRYLLKANRFSRTPMALTKYLGTTRGTMSQTIIALERKGYVERLPSQTDKRSVNVELTKVGRKKLSGDPLQKLAHELETALGQKTGLLSEMLEQLFAQIIKANNGHLFGLCHTCRYFKKNGGSTKTELHHCGLLDVGLSITDSKQICVEQELP